MEYFRKTKEFIQFTHRAVSKKYLHFFIKKSFYRKPVIILGVNGIYHDFFKGDKLLKIGQNFILYPYNYTH